METAELIKIWNTLAANKLIDKTLARESILQIISKKGNGIIHKMIKKANVDFYLFLVAAILIPLILLTAHFFIPAQFTDLQSYIGLSVAELFFIYMINVSLRNRKFLNISFNNESIKESIGKVNAHLKLYLKNYMWISLIFGYIFLTFAFVRFLTRIGGIKNFSLYGSGFNLFASHFMIVILALIVIFPFLVKLEIKLRFSRLLKDINQLLDQLNEEK